MRTRTESRGKAGLHRWRLAPWLCAGLLGALLVGDAVGTDSRAAREEGVGGTGAAPAGEGLGGTGIERERSEDGIGGTGVVAGRHGGDDGIGGTGIMGTITGFGSILANGLVVEYDRETPVEIDGRPVSAAELALGQVVRVEAERSGAELWARRISVQSEVKGPVWRIDRARGEWNVLGQTVKLGPGALLYDRVRKRAVSSTDIRLGDFVQVSGLRRGDGVIVASRLERAAPQAEARVAGPVTSVGSGGAFRVFGLRIGSLAEQATIDTGDRVVVVGRWERGELRPTRVEVEPEVPFSGRFEEISVEGYARARAGDGAFQLHGLTVDLSEIIIATEDSGLGEIDGELRVRVRGRLLGERRLAAHRIDIEEGEDSERVGWRSLEAAGSATWGEGRDREDSLGRSADDGSLEKGQDLDGDSDSDSDSGSDSDSDDNSDSDADSDSDKDSDSAMEDDSDD